MNCLNVKISYFKNNKDTANPATVSLWSYLNSGKHRNRVEELRAAQTDVERIHLKERLPGITPHGVFSYRDAAHLVKHSGLIQGDIDFKQNPYDPESIKREISKLANVAYCGLSASGNGLWFLVPIADLDKHAEHYAAMVQDFARLGLVLDTKVKGVESFRYFSFDPAPYFNPQATPYERLLVLSAARPLQARKTSHSIESSPAVWAANYLAENAAADAYDYGDYMRIAAACKFEWGEAGKDNALAILDKSPAFSASNFCRDFESHWQSFKRAGGYVATGAELVRRAKKHREGAAHNAPQRPTFNEPEQSVAIPRNSRQSFTDKKTGEKLEVVLCPDGYPATWDAAPPQGGSLPFETAKAMLEANAWRCDGVTAITPGSDKADQEAKSRRLRWYKPSAPGTQHTRRTTQ